MNSQPQKILVRLPNWLGDMVMSVGFIRQLPHYFPHCEVSVIVKKGLEGLLPYFPPTVHRFVFSKEEYKGLRGIWRFGRNIKQQERFDLFFCLPDSFSSAWMGLATGAKKRIGYRKELRNLLLTDASIKPKGVHRVEEYIALLQQFTGQPPYGIEVKLEHPFAKGGHMVVNVNSEAQSRRLPLPKAVEVISELQKNTASTIYLIGAPKEKPFIDAVCQQLPSIERMENVAGKTSFPELISLLARARYMLTTDSGPAHLANALGTPTLVLFGAGNENNTAPYNAGWNTVVRLGKLPCEPCLKNVCVKYQTPQCLVQLSTEHMVHLVMEKAEKNGKKQL